METVGERLAARMAARGVSQSELAARVGVRASAVNKWISGANNMDVPTLERVCYELSASADSLLGLPTANALAEQREAAVAAAYAKVRGAVDQALDQLAADLAKHHHRKRPALEQLREDSSELDLAAHRAEIRRRALELNS